MSEAEQFNRAEAIQGIADFAGKDTSDPEQFKQWLQTLTDDQLRHFHQNINQEQKTKL